MRLLPLLSLTLATLTAANPISIPSDHASSDLTLVPRNDPRSFTGRGQLRTRWYQGDYDDLGCLTDTGLWTSDESQCGTFTAQPLEGVSTLVTYTLSSAAGPCWIVGAKFECGWGQQPGWFGIWPFPNSIPGVDCMRYGNYGLMASSKGGPPRGSPQEVHFTSYSEPGKWVWLTWEGVEH